MPERNDLDRLIDSELASYAEPRIGLEQRVLARVIAEESKRHWPVRTWQRWALGGAVAALAIVMVVVALSRTAHRESEANTARPTSPDRGAVASSTSTIPYPHIQNPHFKQTSDAPRNIARRRRLLASPERIHRPKLEVFPAPQPLSAQEQALLAIATAPAAVSRENLIASQRELDVPVQISAISIPPLTQPDEGIK